MGRRGVGVGGCGGGSEAINRAMMRLCMIFNDSYNCNLIHITRQFPCINLGFFPHLPQEGQMRYIVIFSRERGGPK